MANLLSSIPIKNMRAVRSAICANLTILPSIKDVDRDSVDCQERGPEGLNDLNLNYQGIRLAICSIQVDSSHQNSSLTRVIMSENQNIMIFVVVMSPKK